MTRWSAACRGRALHVQPSCRLQLHNPRLLPPHDSKREIRNGFRLRHRWMLLPPGQLLDPIAHKCVKQRRCDAAGAEARATVPDTLNQGLGERAVLGLAELYRILV